MEDTVQAHSIAKNPTDGLTALKSNYKPKCTQCFFADITVTAMMRKIF